MTTTELPQLTRKDFQSDQEVRWCPGCGDYAILAAMQSFLADQGARPESTVFISGIGCFAIAFLLSMVFPWMSLKSFHGMEYQTLEDLAYSIKDTALCGLGQTAPNPVLTTIKYFREEYEAHINDKRCPAGVVAGRIVAQQRHVGHVAAGMKARRNRGYLEQLRPAA